MAGTTSRVLLTFDLFDKFNLTFWREKLDYLEGLNYWPLTFPQLRRCGTKIWSWESTARNKATERRKCSVFKGECQSYISHENVRKILGFIQGLFERQNAKHTSLPILSLITRRVEGHWSQFALCLQDECFAEGRQCATTNDVTN